VAQHYVLSSNNPNTPITTYTETMFNALNRFISRLDGDTPSAKENYGAFGFQVLRNENLQLGIEPWFDFIVGINGRMIVCGAYPHFLGP